MKRDHLCFALFLTLLLIAPRVPVSAVLEISAARASLSLGFMGLLFWLMVSPKPILKIGVRPFWAFLVVFFALYGWFVSLFSGNAVSILYASQYFFYSLVSFSVLRNYLLKASELNEFDKVFTVLNVVGLVYAAAALISLFAGPIYPYQTFWSARLVSGVWVQRATGFAGNPNNLGGILVFFLAAAMFLSPPRWRYRWLGMGVTGAALIATLSRSGILSFVFGYLATVGVWCVRAAFTGKIDRRLFRGVVLTVFFAVGIVAVATLASHSVESVRVALASLGFGTGARLDQDVETRLALWGWGIHSWERQGAIAALFGVGFRNSMLVSAYGTWVTPHSFYITALCEFGLVGALAIVITLLGAIGHASLRLLTAHRELNMYSFALLVLCALSIHNMTEVFLYSPTYVFLLLFAILLTEAADTRCRVRTATPRVRCAPRRLVKKSLFKSNSSNNF